MVCFRSPIGKSVTCVVYGAVNINRVVTVFLSKSLSYIRIRTIDYTTKTIAYFIC